MRAQHTASCTRSPALRAHLWTTPLLMTMLLLAACSPESSQSTQSSSQSTQTHAEHAQPSVGSRTGVAALDVYVAAQRIHLLTAHSTGDVPLLMHAVSDDDGQSWSEPVLIDAVPPHSPSRGSDPQVAAWQEVVVAVWTPSGTDEWGGGPLISALSRDGGKTWRAGPSPAPEGASGGQYYIDITADAGGSFHLVWLDDRSGKRGLRYARSNDGGQYWSAPATLDETTCECCWNTVAAHANTIYVLYRDTAPRDMALVRSEDRGGTWRNTGRVGAFDWNVEACPHSGGGLALADAGAELHAIVSTLKTDRVGLHHLRLDDEGGRWSAPRRVGSAGASHPDLAINDGVLLATWHEWSGNGTAIHYALSHDHGENWSSPRRLSVVGAAATHPRVVSTRSGFRVFWTERREGAESSWNSAAIALASTGRRQHLSLE